MPVTRKFRGRFSFVILVPKFPLPPKVCGAIRARHCYVGRRRFFSPLSPSSSQQTARFLEIIDIPSSSSPTSTERFRIRFNITASGQSLSGETLTVPVDKLQDATTVRWGLTENEAVGTYDCPMSGSVMVCNFTQDPAFHFTTEQLSIVTFLNPISSFCGGWYADFVFSADQFESRISQPGVSLVASLEVADRVLTPLSSDVGGNVTIGFSLNGTCNSSSGEKVVFSNALLDNTYTPQFGLVLGEAPNILTPVACTPNGANWECNLNALPSPVFSDRATYYYVNFRPAATTVGPINLDMTFSAQFFNDITVNSGNHTAYGRLTVASSYSSTKGMQCTWPVVCSVSRCLAQGQGSSAGADLPLVSASSDMIRWSRVLLSHTLDAARSY